MTVEIVRAGQAGFCYGVRRATRMALELQSRGHRPLFTLGPLMHNPQEVARLTKLGIEPRERIEDCLGGKTLVRTHGISLEEQRRAESLGIELVDATCPHVKVPRRRMEKFLEQGREVLLLGDAGHPEVQAMLSYARGPVHLVTGPDDLPGLPRGTPVGLVAQTTQTRSAFQRTAQAARRRYPDTEAVCTVCEDTAKRQAEGLHIAGRVDLVVVVGGKSSANTRRLAGICKEVQPRTIQVESVGELEAISFGGLGSIGLLSGASTPDWIIEDVDRFLRQKVLEKSLTR